MPCDVQPDGAGQHIGQLQPVLVARDTRHQFLEWAHSLCPAAFFGRKRYVRGMLDRWRKHTDAQNLTDDQGKGWHRRPAGELLSDPFNSANLCSEGAKVSLGTLTRKV